MLRPLIEHEIPIHTIATYNAYHHDSIVFLLGLRVRLVLRHLSQLAWPIDFFRHDVCNAIRFMVGNWHSSIFGSQNSLPINRTR